MVNFINPGILGDLTTFRRVFQGPIEKGERQHATCVGVCACVWLLYILMRFLAVHVFDHVLFAQHRQRQGGVSV